MTIRDLEESDIPVLKRLHEATGFDYRFPDLLSSDFVRVQVVVDDAGEIVLAIPVKKSIEAYLVMNPEWGSPRQRLLAFQVAHADMKNWLFENGWSEVNAWPPPKIEKSFGKRLVQTFGWARNRWNSFSLQTGEK